METVSFYKTHENLRLLSPKDLKSKILWEPSLLGRLVLLKHETLLTSLSPNIEITSKHRSRSINLSEINKIELLEFKEREMNRRIVLKLDN